MLFTHRGTKSRVTRHLKFTWLHHSIKDSNAARQRQAGALWAALLSSRSLSHTVSWTCGASRSPSRNHPSRSEGEEDDNVLHRREQQQHLEIKAIVWVSLVAPVLVSHLFDQVLYFLLPGFSDWVLQTLRSYRLIMLWLLLLRSGSILSKPLITFFFFQIRFGVLWSKLRLACMSLLTESRKIENITGRDRPHPGLSLLWNQGWEKQ